MQPLSSSQRKTLERYAGMPLGPAGSDYLAARGLAEVATDLRFGEVSARDDRYRGRLVIPSLGPGGAVQDVAFRCIAEHDCSAEDCAKYLFLPGVPKRTYNTRALVDSPGEIHITEGQIDAATLVACGLPAVGIPGANNFPPHRGRIFSGFPRVVVWPDGDEAGSRFTERVLELVPRADVAIIPDGYDVNSYYTERGRDALLRLMEDDDDDDPGVDGPPAESEPGEVDRLPGLRAMPERTTGQRSTGASRTAATTEATGLRRSDLLDIATNRRAD